MIFIDQMKRRVELKDFPKRIVSLVPSQTELLFYLTSPDKIVGITRFCIHPREFYLSKQKVGGTKDFDFEKIDTLKPDLIIGNKEENYPEGIEKLAQKYPVWMSDIANVNDSLAMIKEIGKLLNETKKATLLAEKIANQFYLLDTQKTWGSPRKAAYFIWKKPLMVAGSDTYIDDILSRIGLINVFANSNSRYPEVSEQQLKVAQPDFIFLSSEPYPFKEKHIGYFKELCPRAQVKIVDGEMFSWYGSRMLDASEYLLQFKKELVTGTV